MRRSQAPRTGWGGQGSGEPSLCFPPFPSFLPSLPLLSAAPEQLGSWSAAMDRYSMEELIQLGQGRVGLGQGAGFQKGGVQASSWGSALPTSLWPGPSAGPLLEPCQHVRDGDPSAARTQAGPCLMGEVGGPGEEQRQS